MSLRRSCCRTVTLTLTPTLMLLKITSRSTPRQPSARPTSTTSSSITPPRTTLQYASTCTTSSTATIAGVTKLAGLTLLMLDFSCFGPNISQFHSKQRAYGRLQEAVLMRLSLPLSTLTTVAVRPHWTSLSTGNGLSRSGQQSSI
jgi:hypothetical protein